jgi:hypothetical protein
VLPILGKIFRLVGLTYIKDEGKMCGPLIIMAFDGIELNGEKYLMNY